MWKYFQGIDTWVCWYGQLTTKWFCCETFIYWDLGWLWDTLLFCTVVHDHENVKWYFSEVLYRKCLHNGARKWSLSKCDFTKKACRNTWIFYSDNFEDQLCVSNVFLSNTTQNWIWPRKRGLSLFHYLLLMDRKCENSLLNCILLSIRPKIWPLYCNGKLVIYFGWDWSPLNLESTLLFFMRVHHAPNK